MIEKKDQWKEKMKMNRGLDGVSAVLMVSPDSFSYNPQTAQSNSFSTFVAFESPKSLRATVQSEFEGMVSNLKKHHIKVIEIQSPTDVVVPDAVFPNNWFSLHLNPSKSRVLTLYPMESENRRLERQVDLLKNRLSMEGYVIDELNDLTSFEQEGQFLESTGSMVIDHANQVIFACQSSRTHPELVEHLAHQWGYQAVLFHAYDKNKLIYHTNVLMSIGNKQVVLCPDVIDAQDRKHVMKAVDALNKELVCVCVNQLRNMCCNVLELYNQQGRRKMVMSQRAFEAFNPEQRKQLTQDADLIVSDISTIESISGGSARCMLAEIR